MFKLVQMKMMKKILGIFLVTFLIVVHPISLKAQEQQEEKDITTMSSDDYINLKLPPLSILYENAKNTPSIEFLAKQKQLQEKLLSKEKRGWLQFFSAKAGYAYGKTDNYGSLSDPSTPIFYQYTGVAQHYYNAGANINIPFESLFDLGGKIKRQKIAVESAELQKQEAFNQLKIQISQLYVEILSSISTLKLSAEAVALTQGEYQLAENSFRNGSVEAYTLSEIKKRQVEANTQYEEIRTKLNIAIFQLEILANTPIISK